MTDRERQMAELEEVLAELIALGLVLEQQGTDMRTYYRVNPQKLSDIRTLLQLHSQPSRRQRRCRRASSIALSREVPNSAAYH